MKNIVILLILLLVLSGCNAKGETMGKDEMVDYVTKQGGTEQPFQNEYWDEKRPGIYVDINTGEALFSSQDKYDSGTGWPSFTKPIDESKIIREVDTKLGMKRTEVKTDASHLGHVFDDGPDDGQRFCINSAALKFIPYDQLDEQGYGEYKELFKIEKATFGAGCFWGVEHLLKEIDGVIETEAGYMGGEIKNPTYKEVSTGKTGYAEVVQITYDKTKVTYEEILDYFWRLHDPTQLNKQGYDVGTQYRSVIFYHTDEQALIAEKSKLEFDKKQIFKDPAVTQIVKAKEFYLAEDYHQDYYENNPSRVCHSLRDE